jgi:DNA-binding FrmR family transcriptional regulator
MDPLPSGGMEPTPRIEPGYIKRQDDYARRLKRIEGQVKGIERMVAQETYCIDILTQVSAVTKALQAVALGLLDEHVEFCVLEAARGSADDAQAKLREASEAIGRLVRS